MAAALASDLKDSYAIDHVVTAGSPVANHPIPPKTWVTSIEIEDELVASLDGGRNPSTEQWLTVRGKVTQTTGVTPPTVNADGSCTPGQNTGSAESNYAGALVADAPKTKEISHWLKYHQPRTATPPISARPPWTRTNGISSRSSTANSSTPDTTRGACRMNDGRARTGNTGKQQSADENERRTTCRDEEGIRNGGETNMHRFRIRFTAGSNLGCYEAY